MENNLEEFTCDICNREFDADEESVQGSGICDYCNASLLDEQELDFCR